MSYILDALRKADQEREQQRLGVPTITTMHFVREGMKRRGLLMLLLSGCAVAGLVIWLAWPSSVPVSPVVPRPGVEKGAGDSSRSPTVVSQPAAPPYIPPQARRIPLPPPPPREVGQDTRGTETGGRGEDLSVGRGGPGRGSAKSEAAAVMAPPVTTEEKLAPGSDTAPASPPAVPSPAPPAPAPSLRDAMAKMTVETLLHTENPEQRMVVINGRRYVEGQYVEGRYLIEAITPEGAVLSYQGERALLTP